MGDIFFVIRMAIYTILIVLFMQVKIGTTTLEEKVSDWTHRSELSSVLKGVAEGAVTFIGIGYNRAVQNVNTSFSRNHNSDQIPGQRLKKEIDSTKEFIKEQFEDTKEKIKAQKEELDN